MVSQNGTVPSPPVNSAEAPEGGFILVQGSRKKSRQNKKTLDEKSPTSSVDVGVTGRTEKLPSEKKKSDGWTGRFPPNFRKNKWGRSRMGQKVHFEENPPENVPHTLTQLAKAPGRVITKENTPPALLIPPDKVPTRRHPPVPLHPAQAQAQPTHPHRYLHGIQPPLSLWP